MNKKINKTKTNNNKYNGADKMNKNLNKPKINDAENFGILFRIQKDNNIYHINCIMIEKGKFKTVGCISNIENKKYAEKLLPMFKNHWDKYNKILQFSDFPKYKNQTQYDDIHKRNEVTKYFEEFTKNNVSNEIEEIEYTINETYKILGKLEKTLEEIKK